MLFDYDYWFGNSIYSQRKVNDFIRTYYSFIAVLLYRQKLIPTIPRLEFTNAKGYNGRITCAYGHFTNIKISRWNTLNPYRDYDDFLDEITQTICHELAHMLVWEHGEEHTDTTKQIRIFAESNIEIYRLQKILAHA